MYEPKTQTRAAGAGLIFLGIYLNIPFSILSATFRYPDILRAPTGEILEEFQKGGPGLIAVWYSFTFAALAMVCVVKLLERVEWGNQAVLLNIGTTFGVVGGILQALGLIRWVFVVPSLAAAYTAPDASDAAKDTAAVVFNAFHQYAGVAIGEHLGQLFTSAWIIVVSAAVIRSERFASILGFAGLAIGFLMILGLVEGLGTVSEIEVGIAAVFTPISFIALSIWMIVIGSILIWQTSSRSIYFQRVRFNGGH